jgi:hypothetical protein
VVVSVLVGVVMVRHFLAIQRCRLFVTTMRSVGGIMKRRNLGTERPSRERLPLVRRAGEGALLVFKPLLRMATMLFVLIGKLEPTTRLAPHRDLRRRLLLLRWQRWYLGKTPPSPSSPTTYSTITAGRLMMAATQQKAPSSRHQLTAAIAASRMANSGGQQAALLAAGVISSSSCSSNSSCCRVTLVADLVFIKMIVRMIQLEVRPRIVVGLFVLERLMQRVVQPRLMTHRRPKIVRVSGCRVDGPLVLVDKASLVGRWSTCHGRRVHRRYTADQPEP